MKLRALFLMLICANVHYAAVADTEFFIGVTNTSFDKLIATGPEFEAIDDKTKGFELGVVYQLFDVIGLEGGYSAFGSADYYSRFCRDVCIPEPNEVKTDVTAWNAGVNARVPLGAFVLRASANRYFFDDDSEMLFDSEWVYRAGVDVELGDTLGLGVGYKKGGIIDSGFDARVTIRF